MALKEIIVETQASLRADAANAKAVFSVDSRQVENLRSEARIRQFSLTVDEPPTLGGSDAGPNPVELILAGLATCQEITYRAYATALGVPLDSVSVKLEGVLDLRGFFAVDERVRAGFTGVRGTVTLKSSASKDELAKLKEVVDAHCPVLDILRAPVPVEIELAAVPVALAAGVSHSEVSGDVPARSVIRPFG
jgi:putative redox protein